MKNQLGGFADISDVSDIGEVDLFGFDAFGNPAGLGAGWGAAIGAGVGTAGAVAIRALAPDSKTGQWMFKYSEALGAALGILTGGIMALVDKEYRHAGWVCMGTAAIVNGVRQVEYLFPATKPEVKETAKDQPVEAVQAATDAMPAAAAAAAAGQLAPSQPQSGVEFEPTPRIPLGIATMEPTGAVMAGSDGQPQLLGADAPAHRQATATLLGVPGLQGPLAGMASSFGATIFGN